MAAMLNVKPPTETRAQVKMVLTAVGVIVTCLLTAVIALLAAVRGDLATLHVTPTQCSTVW